MYERIRSTERALESLRIRLGRDPLAGEIAAELGLTVSEVQKALRVPHEPISTDDPSNSDWSERLDGSLTESVLAEDRLALVQLQNLVANTVDSLKPKEALILRMRYGLGTEHEHTLEEVGHALEVTRERIRQIEKKALKLLKERLGRGAAEPEPQRVEADSDFEELKHDRQDPPTARPARGPRAKVTELAPPLPHATVIEPEMTIESRSRHAVVHTLKLLASAHMQRGIAASLDVPSFQREFAHRWFQVYSSVDPDGNFTATEHSELQRVSAELRKALRLLGFGRVEIGHLLRDPGWLDVIAVASGALGHLTDG